MQPSILLRITTTDNSPRKMPITIVRNYGIALLPAKEAGGMEIAPKLILMETSTKQRTREYGGMVTLTSCATQR